MASIKNAAFKHKHNQHHKNRYQTEKCVQCVAVKQKINNKNEILFMLNNIIHFYLKSCLLKPVRS